MWNIELDERPMMRQINQIVILGWAGQTPGLRVVSRFKYMC
jgi:hypothetical protein